MAALSAVCVLSVLQLAHCSVTYRHNSEDSVLVDGKLASSFLSRSLLYNSWDFELIRSDDLERECIEEKCSYEEAREVFEDDDRTRGKKNAVFMDFNNKGKDFYLNTLKNKSPSSISSDSKVFWESYIDSQAYAPGVDVSGLVAGIMAILVLAVIATVLGIYCYKARSKGGRSVPVRMAADGRPVPESVPLAQIIPPGLPTYSEALHHSGQHDAPPPPYSGGAPSEVPEPEDNE